MRTVNHSIAISAFGLVTLMLSGALQAQTCSGGPDGGMDATGNQCSTPAELPPASDSRTAGKAPNDDEFGVSISMPTSGFDEANSHRSRTSVLRRERGDTAMMDEPVAP